MIDIPVDLVCDLPCVQQASYLEGGQLMWMLPLYLHVSQKSDYDDMIYTISTIIKCGIWQPVKNSLSLSFLNWIKTEMIFYGISEFMLPTLIQRYNKKSFHFWIN